MITVIINGHWAQIDNGKVHALDRGLGKALRDAVGELPAPWEGDPETVVIDRLRRKFDHVTIVEGQTTRSASVPGRIY